MKSIPMLATCFNPLYVPDLALPFFLPSLLAPAGSLLADQSNFSAITCLYSLSDMISMKAK